jgi:5'-nucleotidase
MNRRDFIRKAGLLTAGLSVSPITSWGMNKERLVILHTNDWHSHIHPFSLNHKKYPGMGGASRRASIIKEIRSKYKNVLLLDSGDIFQGTPYFNQYGGELEFKLMSEMDYDFATLGNHDFDLGIEGLHKQLPKASFKFLCANYDFKNTLLDGHIDQYTIIKKGKFKVGIFGIGIELNGLVPTELYGNIIYHNPINRANQIAKKLKSEGCHLVICLSHLGYNYKSDKVSDVILAKNSENIDLILGGHTHTFLKAPHKIRNQINETVFINQTGWAGLNLGRIDYEYNSNDMAHLHNYSYEKIS